MTAAVTADGQIARDRDEVVDWSRDLPLFRKQTMGWPVIIGSRTCATMATDLDGRQMIVVNRNTDPAAVLLRINSVRSFVIGGSRTYARFAPWLTHVYLTYHPLVFGAWVPIFTGLKHPLNLRLEKTLAVDEQQQIYQYQYSVLKP